MDSEDNVRTTVSDLADCAVHHASLSGLKIETIEWAAALLSIFKLTLTLYYCRALTLPPGPHTGQPYGLHVPGVVGGPMPSR